MSDKIIAEHTQPTDKSAAAADADSYASPPPPYIQTPAVVIGNKIDSKGTTTIRSSGGGVLVRGKIDASAKVDIVDVAADGGGGGHGPRGAVVVDGKIDGKSHVSIETDGDVEIRGKIDASSTVKIKAGGGVWIQGKIDGSSVVLIDAPNGTVKVDGKVDGASTLKYRCSVFLNTGGAKGKSQVVMVDPAAEDFTKLKMGFIRGIPWEWFKSQGLPPDSPYAVVSHVWGLDVALRTIPVVPDDSSGLNNAAPDGAPLTALLNNNRTKLHWVAGLASRPIVVRGAGGGGAITAGENGKDGDGETSGYGEDRGADDDDDDQGLPVWMDVFSIDQEDAKDKSLQVSVMDAIYERSSVCYLCLEDVGLLEKLHAVRDRWAALTPEQRKGGGGDEGPVKVMDALHATLDKTAHFKRLWTLQEFALTKRKKIVLCPDDGATSTPPSPPVVLELKDIIPYPLGGAFYWYYQMVFNCTVQPLFDGQLGMWDSVGSHGGTNGYFTIHFSRGSPRQSSILKDQVYGTHKVLEIPVTQPYEVDDNVALFKEFLRGVLTHPRIECKFDEREVEAFLDVVADRSKDRQAVEMLWALFGKCSGVWMEKTVRTMAVLGVMPVEQLEPGAAPAGKRPETGGQMSF